MAAAHHQGLGKVGCFWHRQADLHPEMLTKKGPYLSLAGRYSPVVYYPKNKSACYFQWHAAAARAEQEAGGFWKPSGGILWCGLEGVPPLAQDCNPPRWESLLV